MTSSDYRRVNHRRVCRVCGKPDWCSYTSDETVSFCARIVQGADRISRNGWGIFFRDYAQSTFRSLPFPPKTIRKKPELAPIDVRDFAYRKLIELAPATNSKGIIDGLKGLRSRRILDFDNYGSLPKSSSERDQLAKHLRQLVNANFPDFDTEHLSGIIRVPGFWIDKSGKARLWLEKDVSRPMLLIPYRDNFGMIQACQIRLMDEVYKVKKDSLRYLWLSTPKKSNGLSCGSPVHYATQLNCFTPSPIIITEGALKAETVKVFQPNRRIIATGGVNSSHVEIIAATRFSPVSLAFDGDSITNRHIARAMANLMLSRLLDSREHRYKFDLKILTWDKRQKGIDDALLQGSEIFEISPAEWFASLAKSSRNEVARWSTHHLNTVQTAIELCFK